MENGSLCQQENYMVCTSELLPMLARLLLFGQRGNKCMVGTDAFPDLSHRFVATSMFVLLNRLARSLHISFEMHLVT